MIMRKNTTVSSDNHLASILHRCNYNGVVTISVNKLMQLCQLSEGDVVSCVYKGDLVRKPILLTQ